MPTTGELTHSIEIQAHTVVRSSSGAEIPTWVTTWTVRAKIEPIRGSESLSAGIQNAEVEYRIWVWYRAGVTTKHRILFGTRVFNIIQAANFHEGNEWLEILAKEDRDV